MTADEAQRAYQRVISDVVKACIEPEASDVDEKSRFPEKGYHALASVGLLVAHLPEAVGGGGGGMTASVMAIEEVARACASTAAVVAAAVEVSTALGLGAGELARDLIGQIASGDHVAAWVGEDIAYASTPAGYVLQGRGTWVANAERAQSLVVAAHADANTDSGVVLLLAAADQAGVRVGAVETDLGLRGCSLRPVELQDVLVSPALLLAEGAPARAALESVAAHHALAVAALSVGIAAGALAQARSYVLERVQFGRRIADFPAMRAILAEAFVRVDAARQLVRTAAGQVDGGAAGQYVISAALLAATETAAAVTIEAVQAFGGYGYVKEYPVERMMRDAQVARLLVGSRATTVQSVAAHFLA